ncbi:hypothetical protein OPIT5_15445 [Opitutaceae bacterium TAV5]|nr:hypothetical protein OPIT5_15445 [Opitutaceae bacterium TAV5]
MHRSTLTACFRHAATRSLFALLPSFLPAAPAYEYPSQPGLEHILKTDPDRTLLTDGRTGASGPMAVWGKWDTREMLIDWTFPSPVRVKALRVVIVHPRADSPDSHTGGIRLHADGGPDGAFFPEPDFIRKIPFEAIPLQEARIALPGDGIVTTRLRTLFEAARHQVVLSEVSFETGPATEAEAAAAQAARTASQPEQFAPVSWLPPPLAPDARVTGNSIFGACGHFLHTDYFMPGNPNAKPGSRDRGFNANWRPERTLPWLVEANFSWVREALYRNLFVGPENTRRGNGRLPSENRRQVEDYLALYQARGLRVLLCPMFGGAQSSEGFEPFATWIGDLVRRFPCVQAVELHNEPNLRGFWKGTPQEFVEAARLFAATVKKTSPQARIVAGSFAGWGGAWQHDDLKELLPGPREIATRYAEEVFRLGLLEFADAVSAHPYRGHSAPEGGEVLESPTDPDGFAKEIRTWLDLAARHTPGGKRLPFYISEIGYSVSAQGYTNVPDEARQADYLSRLMLVLLGVKLDGIPLEGVFWYDLKQDERPDNHYESNFGLVTPDASRPRPAWLAARRVAQFFDNDADLRPLAASGASRPLVFSNGPDLIKSYVWQRVSDGSLVVPFWRMNQLMKKDTDFDSELTLALPSGFHTGKLTVTLHDLHEDRPRSTGFTLTENENGVTGRPILKIPLHVTSRAAWLVIAPE